MKIEVRRGEAARRSCADPAFRAEWQALAAATPWPHVFQEPAWCRSWFAAYADRYEPLLILGRADGTLVGLLALGIEDGRPCHAGDHQCEYQAWLARPTHASAFGVAATRAAMALTGTREWRWSHLAPGLPDDYLDRLQEEAGLPVTRATATCPLMDVRDADFLAARMRGRLRSHRNQLQRRGLRYERVVDHRRALQVLDRLALWCDLRQGAAHDVMPFSADPAKHDFHRRLLAWPERFWLSALWLDDELLAAHLGPFDGTELALGIQAYAPREARRSPGAILMLEIAADLAAFGAPTLDLTPGGDPWKERYASHHREIVTATVHRGRLAGSVAAAGRGLESGAREVLRRLGADPGQLRSSLRAVAGGRSTLPMRALWVLDVLDDGMPESELTAQRPAAAALDALLVEAARGLDEARRSVMLEEAGRCQAEGWEPWVVVEDGALAALAWTPPDEGWVDLEEPAAPRLRRDQPDAEASALPDDVRLLRLATLDRCSPGALRALLGATGAPRQGRAHTWLLAERSVAELLGAQPLADGRERLAG